MNNKYIYEQEYRTCVLLHSFVSLFGRHNISNKVANVVSDQSITQHKNCNVALRHDCPQSMVWVFKMSVCGCIPFVAVHA